MSGIEVSGAKVLFHIGPVAITETVISLVIATLLLGICGWLCGRNLQKRPGGRQVLVEKGVSMLRNLVVGTMGAHNASWVPYIGTIFLSSIVGSLLSLTGFLRSTTADLSVVLTWALMTSVIIWYQNIKRNGFFGWLKGFAEPIAVMTPMNIVSEIAQPVAMAFRHFGNVAGGGIITMIIYTALALASTALMGLIAGTVAVPAILIALGILLLVLGMKKEKTLRKILGIVFAVLGVVGLVEYFGLLQGIPILQVGIPAVFSIYFDLFSGFVQAFVFSLLSMVYIAGACPPPEEKTTIDK
ncbi:MAG: F0F1 ATP synthase subunit A [Ruminococcaceae bacterium]|nr:F0F1 ATP synthase subunit A [Oscillospiraceae bacterium]